MKYIITALAVLMLTGTAWGGEPILKGTTFDYMWQIAVQDDQGRIHLFKPVVRSKVVSYKEKDWITDAVDIFKVCPSLETSVYVGPFGKRYNCTEYELHWQHIRVEEE